MEFSQLFLYVPGIVIFLVGSGEARLAARRNRLGESMEGYVKKCTHIVKKDAKERKELDYYSCIVEWTDKNSGKTSVATVKSPTEYAEGQPVELFKDGGKDGGAVIAPPADESLFPPMVATLLGALLILLALETNLNNQMAAMGLLAAVFLLTGASMLLDYLKKKKEPIVPIEAEITEVYTRQLTQKSKWLKSDSFTYYPVVSFELDGKKYIRRCHINSSGKKAFTVGEKMTLFLNQKDHKIMEKGARLVNLIAGIILLGLGLLVAVTTLAELL